MPRALTNRGVDVLLVSWDGGGNVPPMLALGRRLVARGRRVSLLGPDALGGRAESAGLRFRAFGGEMSWASRPGVSIEDEMSSLSAHLTGPEIGIELLAAAEDARPKALVVDGMAAGAVAAAERLRIPTAVLIHTRYRYNEAAGWLRLVVPVNSARRQFGLDALPERPGWFSELWRRAGTVLVASFRDLEGVGDEIPWSVRHVGPIFDPDPEPLPSEVSSLVEDQTGPLVVVSLSSTYMHHEEVLARIVQALNEVDVRSVVTLGDALEPARVAAPDHGVVVSWAAHERLLPRCDLVITHGGLGTILGALSAGAPLVCIPLGREQPSNAAEVARIGAGVVVDRTASASAIRRAIEHTLTAASYRDTARRLAAKANDLGHGEQAATIVDALVREAANDSPKPAAAQCIGLL
jgi:UDP:flavonoid glycosyltransferase YjiC (YdhE family)